jgi:hypothetical protein
MPLQKLEHPLAGKRSEFFEVAVPGTIDQCQLGAGIRPASSAALALTLISSWLP